jgi:ankyrin repeat protein
MLVHYIAALGFINTFKVLIEFNCDLNAQTDEGITPLQIAIALGLENVVELLVKNGVIT